MSDFLRELRRSLDDVIAFSIRQLVLFAISFTLLLVLSLPLFLDWSHVSHVLWVLAVFIWCSSLFVRNGFRMPRARTTVKPDEPETIYMDEQGREEYPVENGHMKVGPWRIPLSMVDGKMSKVDHFEIEKKREQQVTRVEPNLYVFCSQHPGCGCTAAHGCKNQQER